jgi:hypothetical protein
MESILFAGSVFGILLICFYIYKSEKNKSQNTENPLGIFAFKVKKDTQPRAGLKK